MSHYKVVDNFMPDEKFQKLRKVMFDDKFPWFLTFGFTSGFWPSEGTYGWYKFHHIMYDCGLPVSPVFQDMEGLVTALDPSVIVTIRAFMTTYTGEQIEQGFHTDYQLRDPELSKCLKNAVFYLDTNNGGTKFEEGGFVESVENRVVIFNGDVRHAGVSSTNSSVRRVISISYF